MSLKMRLTTRSNRLPLKTGRKQRGLVRPLGVAIATALALTAFWLESTALWAFAGVIGTLQLLGTLRIARIERVLQKASTSGDWHPARLRYEEISGEWLWRLEIQGTSPHTIWANPTGDFRNQLPVAVEVCEQGDEGLVVRHGERLAITSVYTRTRTR